MGEPNDDDEVPQPEDLEPDLGQEDGDGAVEEEVDEGYAPL